MSKDELSKLDEKFRRNGKVVVHTDRLETFGGLVLCLLLTGGSVLVLDLGVVYAVAGYIGIAFFGVLGLPLLGWKTITARPVARIDSRGVAVDDLRLTWNEIERFSTFTTVAGELVLVVMTEQAHASHRCNGRRGRGLIDAANSRVVGGHSLSLPVPPEVEPRKYSDWLSQLLRECPRH